MLKNRSNVATSPGFSNCQITDRCALIVVARIVIVPGVRRGNTINLSQHVAMLVLANAYSRVIAFYSAIDCGFVSPVGLRNLPVRIRKDW